MAALFVDEQGQVAKIEMGESAPISIQLATDSSAANNGRGSIVDTDLQGIAILTSMSFDQETNHQFMTSLGQDLFLYVFGNRMGRLTLQGVCFPTLCTSDDTSLANKTSGIVKLMAYYQKNRLSANVQNGNEPVLMRLLLGDKSIAGYISHMNISIADGATRLAMFTLTLNTFDPAED